MSLAGGPLTQYLLLEVIPFRLQQLGNDPATSSSLTGWLLVAYVSAVASLTNSAVLTYGPSVTWSRLWYAVNILSCEVWSHMHLCSKPRLRSRFWRRDIGRDEPQC